MREDAMPFDPLPMSRGYAFDAAKDAFVCAKCGACFHAGQVYPIGESFFTAENAAKAHVQTEHGGALNILLELDKKRNTLTENQKLLFARMSEGKTDAQIAAELGVTASTIRHQRFTFKEKARQAQCYLAIYALATQKAAPADALMDVHESASMVDDRYLTTKAEEQKILQNVFTSLSPLRLKDLAIKEKRKLVALKAIAGCFEQGRRYTEKEVNAILSPIWADHATLRRNLIEYGFMQRTIDCKEYWKP